MYTNSINKDIHILWSQGMVGVHTKCLIMFSFCLLVSYEEQDEYEQEQVNSNGCNAPPRIRLE